MVYDVYVLRDLYLGCIDNAKHPTLLAKLKWSWKQETYAVLKLLFVVKLNFKMLINYLTLFDPW